jgi:hypothetical protein
MPTKPTLVPGIILSDSAERDPKTGRISLIRCFDAKSFLEFPATSGPFVATIWLSNVPERTEFLKLDVLVVEEATSEIISQAAGQIKLGPLLPGGITTSRTVFDLDIPVRTVLFPRPGNYWIVIHLNGEEAGIRPLSVQQL